MARTPEDIHDELLVLRCQDGEADALEVLVRRWSARLLRHAVRLTGDVDGARDVVQESWIAIARGLRRLDDPARFRVWAYRIVTRRCADWVRTRVRTRRMDRHAPLPEPAPHAGATSERDEELCGLRDAIDALSVEHQVVLSLHYREGMTVKEIAASLDVPAGTVKSRLHHARGHLRQTLDDDGASTHATRKDDR